MTYDDLTLAERVGMARDFARAVHAGQTDKSGSDYFVRHLTSAVHWFNHRQLVHSTNDPLSEEDHATVEMALYLHDTVEDTPVTMEMLAVFFPSRVVEIVGLLTKIKGQSKEGYFAAIVRDPLARLAKAADMDSNTRYSRVWLLYRDEPETALRLLDKYLDGFRRIQMMPLSDLGRMKAALLERGADSA